MKHRHPQRSKHWLFRHYFWSQRTPNGTYRRIFGGRYAKADGTTRRINLFKLIDLPIRRHVKIRAQATPFDPAYREYFRQRWHLGMLRRRADRERLAKFQLVC